jgi:hypothetical protein
MLFKEALEQLQSGKAMVRGSWTAQDGYLCIMPEMKYVWKIVLLPAPNAGNYIFSIEDFIAEDWQVFDVETFRNLQSFTESLS